MLCCFLFTTSGSLARLLPRPAGYDKHQSGLNDFDKATIYSSKCSVPKTFYLNDVERKLDFTNKTEKNYFLAAKCNDSIS